MNYYGFLVRYNERYKKAWTPRCAYRTMYPMGCHGKRSRKIFLRPRTARNFWGAKGKKWYHGYHGQAWINGSVRYRITRQ